MNWRCPRALRHCKTIVNSSTGEACFSSELMLNAHPTERHTIDTGNSAEHKCAGVVRLVLIPSMVVNAAPPPSQQFVEVGRLSVRMSNGRHPVYPVSSPFDAGLRQFPRQRELPLSDKVGMCAPNGCTAVGDFSQRKAVYSAWELPGSPLPTPKERVQRKSLPHSDLAPSWKPRRNHCIHKLLSPFHFSMRSWGKTSVSPKHPIDRIVAADELFYDKDGGLSFFCKAFAAPRAGRCKLRPWSTVKATIETCAFVKVTRYFASEIGV